MCITYRYIIWCVVFMQATARFCMPKGNCGCVWDDTKTEISLENIDNPNNVRFQNNPIYLEGGSKSDFVLNYNPCTPFTSEGYCKSVLACQQAVSDKSLAYNAGIPSKFTISTSGSDLVFSYDGIPSPDGYTRSTKITLHCDKSATEPRMDKVILHPSEIGNGEYYAFTLTTACACDSGCKTSSGGSSRGLSTGSLLCILFLVILLVYFIVGTLFLKFYKHYEGTDVIPNYEFWKDMPSKIKDGFVFTKEKLTNRKGGYEAI